MIEAVQQVGLYEMMDYAIIDGDNKIIGLYKGNMAKKQAQMNMKGAERQVGIKKPLKIMPVSNKKKGDTVIGIGELTDKERGEIDEDVKNALAGFDNRIRDGGMDRKDFIKAKELYKRKDIKRLRQHIYSLDTEPLEVVMNLISIQDRPFFDKMYPNTRGGEFLARIAYQHRHLDENIDENKDDEKKRMKGAKLRLKMGDALDEAKFGHVHKGKVIAVGSQSDMNKSAKKKGKIVYPPSPNFRESKKQDTNYVINSPGVKVGDTPKTFKEEIKEWFESNITRAKYQMHHGEDWWWKMNEVHDKMVEKLDEDCCEDCITEEEMPCPPATKDVKLNTKNRDLTVKNHMYGPLNVDEPGDYWEKIAKKWDTTTEAAKKSLCGNCVAFDISPRMKDCMPGETSDGDGELGYCYMHHFKCHSARSCHTWAKGGPIKTDEKSYEWQEKSLGEEIPANATGTNVAGTGSDSSTVPVNKVRSILRRKFDTKTFFKKKKDINESHDTFAGNAVFHVDNDTFANCREGKKKFARWEKYIDLKSTVGQQIRDYAYK